ncbi:amidohydrolase family protein [Maledivibacter halophilus]|uniref:Imidazolonepropionase n=1 Tax=Maledivibacter halophilus TaxID=36842 RepID=A0A1T5J6P2_9FIRM|nr:amidohydrolase family protein [Maledivibacter halophilus]SKC47059.1 Imidazolonepropionase [Maledivibacter halophilus]
MTIFIKSKLLIDGTGREPIENGIVVVEDNRIVELGDSNSIEIPLDSEIIDCSEEIVLPGLIDSHLHAGEDSNREESVLGQHEKPDALRALRGYLSLQKDIKAGVTTVRLLGDGKGCIDKIIRDAINSGEITGPRVLAAVQAIRPTHGTGGQIGVAADGVDQVRYYTRKAISLGADVIKLFVSNISRGETYLDYLRGDLTGVPAFTKDEIAVAVEEAHRAGLKVAVHCIGGQALRWSLEAGVDSIEHGNLIEEDDIPLFLSTGAFLSDPNLHLFFDKKIGFESEGNKTHKWDDLPKWWHEKVRKSREQTRRVMSKALKAGVKFALATDLNHGGLWKEAKYFVEEIGASPMEAILAITKNGAENCGLEKEIGTLEKGKLADIISVKGNPLENIENLKNVSLVMKDGVIIK